MSGQVLGVGVDLVRVPAFATQLALPGSRFATAGAAFSSRELRRATSRAAAKGDSEAVHLAALWALKEAALKAWVSALEQRGLPLPFSVEEVPWAEFTITHSPSGAPALQLIGRAADALAKDFGTEVFWQVSAAHDGDYAFGLAALTQR